MKDKLYLRFFQLFLILAIVFSILIKKYEAIQWFALLLMFSLI